MRSRRTDVTPQHCNVILKALTDEKIILAVKKKEGGTELLLFDKNKTTKHTNNMYNIQYTICTRYLFFMYWLDFINISNLAEI